MGTYFTAIITALSSYRLKVIMKFTIKEYRKMLIDKKVVVLTQGDFASAKITTIIDVKVLNLDYLLLLEESCFYVSKSLMPLFINYAQVTCYGGNVVLVDGILGELLYS